MGLACSRGLVRLAAPATPPRPAVLLGSGVARGATAGGLAAVGRLKPSLTAAGSRDTLRPKGLAIGTPNGELPGIAGAYGGAACCGGWGGKSDEAGSCPGGPMEGGACDGTWAAGSCFFSLSLEAALWCAMSLRR